MGSSFCTNKDGDFLKAREILKKLVVVNDGAKGLYFYQMKMIDNILLQESS